MVTSLASAIRINEIEANPSGSDSGNEWIELYSEEEFDLEGYSLENFDGDVYELGGSFAGYLLIQFDSQWLDNSDEKVYLKNGEEIIDETIVFEDGKNNGKTWNSCNGAWEFLEGSKELVNPCENEEEVEETPAEETSPEEIEEEISQGILEESKEENTKKIVLGSKTAGKIVLNSPKKEFVSNKFVSTKQKVRMGVVYGFLVLCVFLIILLALRRL